MSKETGKLSRSDIVALQKNPSEDVRSTIAIKVAGEICSNGLSGEEVELAQAILRIMVKDAADRVRKALSECLKNTDQIPHDVAMALALDIDDIAVPMLENSPVFTDEDLVSVIQSGACEKQVAIAGRTTVSDLVAGALVDTDNCRAVSVLAANDGAQLSEQTLSVMVEKHGSSEEVVEAMAGRKDLPVEIVERLTAHVSQELQKVLVKRYMIPEASAEQLATTSREKATVDLVEEVASTEDVGKLARQLHSNGRLTASLILRSLCTGDIRFFEAAMAELANVDAAKASIMIHDAGPLGLDAIFRKSQLPQVFFPAFRVAVDVYNSNEFDGGENDHERFKQRMIERILTQYEGIDGEDLDYLINALGRNQHQNRAA